MASIKPIITPSITSSIITSFGDDVNRLLRDALVDLNADGIVSSAGAVTRWLNNANRNQSAYFDGSSYISTPDSGALALTGAVQTFEWTGIAAADWTPAFNDAITSHWNDGGVDQRSWLLRLTTSNDLQFFNSPDGSGALNVNFGSPSFVDGQAYDIKIVRVASSGLLSCYTRPVGGGYALLGTGTGVTGLMFHSSADLKIGARNASSEAFTGTIQKFTLHDDTRLAASWDARDQADYASTTLTSGGVVWTSTGAIYRDKYDVDAVIGTAANLTPSTLNGVPCVHAAGGVGIETTVAPALITTPMTIFLVGKADVLDSGLFQIGRSDGLNGPYVLAGPTAFDFNAGFTRSVAPSDTDPHLFTTRHNGDVTSSGSVSGVGITTGSIGTEGYDYGTLFTNTIGNGNFLTGSIGRHIIFDRALTDLEVALMQRYLIVNSNL
jgi:hypothetical protein